MTLPNYVVFQVPYIGIYNLLLTLSKQKRMVVKSNSEIHNYNIKYELFMILKIKQDGE